MYEQIAAHFSIALLGIILLMFLYDMFTLGKQFIFDEYIEYDESLIANLLSYMVDSPEVPNIAMILALYFVSIFLALLSGLLWIVVLPVIAIIGALLFLRSMVRKMKSSINNSIKKHEERLHN